MKPGRCSTSFFWLRKPGEEAQQDTQINTAWLHLNTKGDHVHKTAQKLGGGRSLVSLWADLFSHSFRKIPLCVFKVAPSVIWVGSPKAPESYLCV